MQDQWCDNFSSLFLLKLFVLQLGGLEHHNSTIGSVEDQVYNTLLNIHQRDCEVRVSKDSVFCVNLCFQLITNPNCDKSIYLLSIRLPLHLRMATFPLPITPHQQRIVVFCLIPIHSLACVQTKWVQHPEIVGPQCSFYSPLVVCQIWWQTKLGLVNVKGSVKKLCHLLTWHDEKVTLTWINGHERKSQQPSNRGGTEIFGRKLFFLKSHI